MSVFRGSVHYWGAFCSVCKNGGPKAALLFLCPDQARKIRQKRHRQHAQQRGHDNYPHGVGIVPAVELGGYRHVGANWAGGGYEKRAPENTVRSGAAGLRAAMRCTVSLEYTMPSGLEYLGTHHIPFTSWSFTSSSTTSISGPFSVMGTITMSKPKDSVILECLS